MMPFGSSCAEAQLSTLSANSVSDALNLGRGILPMLRIYKRFILQSE